ncbi:hypothetical protein ACFL6I_09455 [candidate division KSB1 bacterium]
MHRKKCKHLNITFLGMQDTGNARKHLALYNCLDCYTTISVPIFNIGDTQRGRSRPKAALAHK